MDRSSKALLRGSYFPAIAAVVAAALAGSAQAATLAMGPVEQVNAKASTVVVLGQTYKIAPSTTLTSQSGAAFTLNSLAANTLVMVDGTESAQGVTNVTSVVSLPQLDVPGATQLLVTGVVSAETAAGQIKIGNLSLDITQTLTSDVQNFAIGSLVEVTGTQPNPGGLFLAQHIAPLNPAPSSTAGTAKGILGGGAYSNGILGGGVHANGILGGGVHANGILGGGVSAKGILGGGAHSNGILGGGAHSNGILGGGVHANGILGGGVSAKGILGGGAHSNGILGGGVHSNGILGGGVHANGILGGGVSAKGILGGGAHSNGILGGGRK